jgi:hypothetical protein
VGAGCCQDCCCCHTVQWSHAVRLGHRDIHTLLRWGGRPGGGVRGGGGGRRRVCCSFNGLTSTAPYSGRPTSHFSSPSCPLDATSTLRDGRGPLHFLPPALLSIHLSCIYLSISHPTSHWALPPLLCHVSQGTYVCRRHLPIISLYISAVPHCAGCWPA